MRILGRIVEADRRRVVARALDVAAEITLPSGGHRAGPELIVAADQEAAVVGARVEHVPAGAAVVVDVADVCLEQRAAFAEAFRCLEPATRLRCSGAERTDEPEAERRIRRDASRPRRNDAPEGVRSVRDGSGSARHFHAVEREGIEKCRARPHAALCGDPRAVDQDQRAACGEASNGRNGRVSFGNARDAGNILERLREVDRRARQNVVERHERGTARRGCLDARGSARFDGHRFAEDRFDRDLERSGLGELLDENRFHVPAARQHDEDLEGRRWGRLPVNPAVGSGEAFARMAEDVHLSIRDRLSGDLVDDARVERRAGLDRGCAHQSKDDDRGCQCREALHHERSPLNSASWGLKSVSGRRIYYQRP